MRSNETLQGMAPHKVVIIGGGFGGLQAAIALRKAPVEVTLIDRRNFHLFQPLLYQVATGGLSPANIAAPIRSVLAKQKNANVLLAEVTGLDPVQKRVMLKDGAVPYDSLIVAAGGGNHYFGNDHWEAHAPGLKSIEDAQEIRRRVLLAFETAERESNPEKRKELLTFVIVGAGPTGVELAGALAEIARDTLRREFRKIDCADAKIVLLEGGPRVLPSFAEELSAYAQSALETLNVEVRTNVKVTDIRASGVEVVTAKGAEFIATQTVLWGAGVKASPLGKRIADATGAETDKSGRVIVEKDLTVPKHPDIFIVGDLAHYSHQTGKPLPGVAQVAMQGGEYAASVIRGRVNGREVTKPFHYFDKGNMATIGRRLAVAETGSMKMRGSIAWLAWLFIHLIYIVCFQNRLMVLIQWGFNYITFGRSARLITGNKVELLPTITTPKPPPSEKSKLAEAALSS